VNTVSIAFLVAVVAAIAGYFVWMAYQHFSRGKIKEPSLAEELRAACDRSIRMRISYEGEKEYAEAMAEYHGQRRMRLLREIGRLENAGEPGDFVKGRSVVFVPPGGGAGEAGSFSYLRKAGADDPLYRAPVATAPMPEEFLDKSVASADDAMKPIDSGAGAGDFLKGSKL